MIAASRNRRRLALGIVAACCAGCGGPTKYAAGGSVMLDGAPLSEARILFVPEAPGLKKTGGVVNGGKYRLPADVGLAPGAYQVQVVDDPPEIDPGNSPPDQAARRRLPEFYATATPLRLEVDEHGQGNFDFALKTSP